MRKVFISLFLWYAGAKISVINRSELVNERKRLIGIGIFIMIQQILLFFSGVIFFHYTTENHITPIFFSLITCVLVYNLSRQFFVAYINSHSTESRFLYVTGAFLALVGIISAIPILIANSSSDILAQLVKIKPEAQLEELKHIGFGPRLSIYIDILQSRSVFAFIKAVSLSAGFGILFVIPVLLKKSSSWEEYNKLCLQQDSDGENQSQSIDPSVSIIKEFPEYFNTLVTSVDKQISKTGEDANKEFTKGIVITLLGIFLYVGFIFYWLDYFKNPLNKTNEYKYFGLASSSLLFLFIEGIGLWFLKHNRSLLNANNNLVKYKIEIQKHYLIYFYITKNIKDFTTESEKLKFLENVINKLGSTTVIQESRTEPLNKGGIADILSVLKSISDNIGKISK